MIAFGDALAIVLSKLKGFTQYNFAHIHPGGTLGKKLLLTVNALMYSGNALPLLSAHTPFQELIVTITKKKLGTGIVVDDKQELLGIITDGDLRRACSKGATVFNQTAHDIMTRNPKSTSTTMLAYDALLMMETHTISSLVVLEEQKVVGLLHIHDLVKSGLKG
jgi:arabinose-5-phosphate isomerase